MRKDGYSLLLPEGLLDYFEIVSVEEKPREIRIYLEEKNNISQKASAFEYVNYMHNINPSTFYVDPGRGLG